MKPCRVVGCVALVDDAWPSKLMDTRLVGVCAVHQQFPADELRDLVSRESGGVPRLRRVDVGVSSRGKTPRQAIARLDLELGRLGAQYETLSTNVVLRLDGLPRSDQREPVDPGAAIYFLLAGKSVVLACDKWDRVADNIAAIAGHIEAMRAQERYGVGSLEQAFAGYAALPPKAEGWRAVLGFPPGARPTYDDIGLHYRDRARTAHPDAGGSHDAMARLNAARAAALTELQS